MPLRCSLLVATLLVTTSAATASAQVRGDTLPSASGAGPTLRVEDGHASLARSILDDIVAHPHVTIVAPDTGIVLGRRSDIPRTLVIVGGPARIEGHVTGDLLVIGDLVLRPGARIDGRAIALGGHLVNSSLAIVSGERLTFLDVTARVRRIGGDAVRVALEPADQQPIPVFSLPGAFGVRIPSYDRVDGVSLPFGPSIALADARLRIDPVVTYRSQLGELDPSIVFALASGGYVVDASVERSTFTNDAWIRGDLANSAAAFFVGSDARNYYRAERIRATVGRALESNGRIVTPFVGMQAERAHSAARDSNARSVPYSFLNRNDRIEGMRRTNPGVTGGDITSAIAGARARSYVGPLVGGAELSAEIPIDAPNGAHFVQLTFDGTIGFLTFRDQRFDAFAHAIATSGDRTPSQRYGYLGGGGTIPTLDLLSEGGDELVWLESRYTIPVTAVRLPLVGSPTLTVRHIVGGAGVDRVGTLTQNVALRVAIAALRAEFIIDPEHTSRHELSVGVGLR